MQKEGSKKPRGTWPTVKLELHVSAFMAPRPKSSVLFLPEPDELAELEDLTHATRVLVISMAAV